ncbi:hypothetical protein M569_05156, partial [Genlisea aurea]
SPLFLDSRFRFLCWRIQMQIVVRPTKKGPLTVQVRSTDTIADVKRKIKEAGGTPTTTSHYYLSHAETTLDQDDRTIASYGIKNGDEIFVFILPQRLPPAKIQIFIRILGGATTALDINPLNTVADVKKKMRKKLKYLPEDCWMSLNGRVLVDHVIISDYYIRSGYTIVVHPPIRGGMQIFVK